ncbi:MAG: class I SAM-dependent methyltransferase [Bacteroidia bacterium]|nr:class I SAM-dependent methyltransferase [Bacteroidia bacterium]
MKEGLNKGIHALGLSQKWHRQNYGLIGNAANRKRLQILEELLLEPTFHLVKEEITSRKKDSLRLLHWNCGLGELSLKIADKFRGKLEVVGIDSNLNNLEIARQHVKGKEGDNLTFHSMHKLSSAELFQFDIVFGQFLLSTHSESQALLRKCKEYLKKGGCLIMQEMNFSQFHCYPTSFAFGQFQELYQSSMKLQGLDPAIGSRMNTLLEELGFTVLKAEVIPPIFLAPHHKQLVSVCLESIGQSILNQKLSIPAELHALVCELQNFEQKCNTMIGLPAIYQSVAQSS